jgi:hypothetical protein
MWGSTAYSYPSWVLLRTLVPDVIEPPVQVLAYRERASVEDEPIGPVGERLRELIPDVLALLA